MNLKQARVAKNYNQHDLAILTNISQTKLSLIERGYLSPRPDELQQIASALDVNPSELVFNDRRGLLNQLVCEMRSKKP